MWDVKGGEQKPQRPRSSAETFPLPPTMFVKRTLVEAGNGLPESGASLPACMKKAAPAAMTGRQSTDDH